jgi:hypothetical protein
MKKFLLLFILLVPGLTLTAQIDLGIRAGAHYPFRGFSGDAFQEYINDISDPVNISAYTAGAFAGFNAGSFGIQVEGNLCLNGFSIARLIEGDPFMNVIGSTSIDMDYINALLLARYEVDLPVIRPYVAAGLNLGLPLPEMISNPDLVYFENFDITKTGFAVSLGLRLIDILSLDLRYYHGITNVVSGEISYCDPLYGQSLRLSLGIHIF